MNHSIKVLLLFSILTFFSCTTQVQEIYVNPTGSDENSGLEETPYATIQFAIEKAKEYKRTHSVAQINTR